jgi:hypothetical protein
MEALRQEKDVEIRRLRARLEKHSAAVAKDAPHSPFSPVMSVFDQKKGPNSPSHPGSSAAAPPPPPPPPPFATGAVAAATQRTTSGLPQPVFHEAPPALGATERDSGAPEPPPMVPLPPPALLAPKAGASMSTKMKKLYWSNIHPSRIAGTVWEALNVEQVSVDTREVETLFAAKEAKSSANAQAGSKVLVGDKVRFFDDKRAQAIGVMMSQFKNVDLLGLVDALRRADDQILTKERVEQLLKFCPNEEEEALLTAYDGELKKLGKVEYFFLNLLAIPRLRARLEALDFKLRFDDVACSVYMRLDTVATACREVAASPSLVAVLKWLLAVGNYMNSGTVAAPNSRGFDVTFLAKLGDTKSINDKTTFLHYLAQVTERNGGLISNMAHELQSIEAAAVISLDSTLAELDALRQGLLLVKKEASLAAADGGETDEFAHSFNDFHAIASDVVLKVGGCCVLSVVAVIGASHRTIVHDAC